MPGNRALMRLLATSDEAVLARDFANQITPLTVWRQHDVPYLDALGDRPDSTTGKTCCDLALLREDREKIGMNLLVELTGSSPRNPVRS